MAVNDLQVFNQAKGTALTMNQTDGTSPAVVIQSAGKLQSFRNAAGTEVASVSTTGVVTGASLVDSGGTIGSQYLTQTAAAGTYTSLYTAQGPYMAAHEYALLGSPAYMRTNVDRSAAGNDAAAALTLGVMTAVAIPLNAGEVVTNLTFLSGATAANTPTHYWFALYSSAATPALLSQSADQTTAAWGANTAKTLALGAPQTIAASGVYYAAVMVAGTGVPSLVGRNTFLAAAGAILTGMAVLGETSGAGLTTTAPATIAAPTTVGTVPLVIVT